MGLLTQAQKDRFWHDGVLVVEDAVSAGQLAALRVEFQNWVEESQNHICDYGETLDGRARFDLQPGHSATTPGLRRVQSPEEVSPIFEDVMRNAHTVDYCAELLGSNIRFHHGKVNSKLPGSATAVKWHQDFLFQPMTNDDMITCLLFLDDVTLENGPLEVIPKSHQGPLYPHWRDGIFTGAIDERIIEPQRDKIMKCTGSAGAVCLMHVNLLHGSAPNLSDGPRTLYITTYYAEDAIELSPNHLPSRFTHALVRGEETGSVRCSPYAMQLPAVPKGTSFLPNKKVPIFNAAMGCPMKPQNQTTRIEKLAFETDDGLGAAARLGVIVLQTDQTIEHEFARLLTAKDIALYHARIPNAMKVSPDTLGQMKADLPATAKLLPPSFSFDTIGYACTSGATMIGEDKVAGIIQELHPQAKISNPLSACKAGLAALDVRQLALVTPYPPEVTLAMRDNLKRAGFDATIVASFNQSDDFTVARISQKSVLDAILKAGNSDLCDGVFVSCTSLRTLDILSHAESVLGKPVVSSNQALAWHMMRLSGITHQPEGFGRLFTLG